MNNKTLYTTLLIILCLFHLISNVIWIFLNTAPLPWDQAGHTRLAMTFADFFKGFGFLNIYHYLTLSSYYPPLIHTIIALFILLFGHPVEVAGLVITVFFIVSIWLVYVYTFELSNNRFHALMSTFIYSFLPIVYEHSRWFLLEIPTVTFVLATLIFLQRSRHFTDKRNTTLFFVFAGLAVITKWLSLVYITFPVILSIYPWIYKTNEDKVQLMTNIQKGIYIFCAIIFPWYLFNSITLFQDASTNIIGEASDPQSLFSIQNTLFYLYLFINFQNTLWISILFFLGVVVFAATKNPYRSLIFGSIAWIYILFTFILNKDWRYTMPFLVYSSMITSFVLTWIYSLQKILGVLLIASVIVYFVSLHLLLSFRSSFNVSYQRAIPIPLIGWIDYVNINDNLAHSYNQESWPHEQILQRINESSTQNKKIEVLCLIDQERFNSGNLFLTRDLLGYRNIEIQSPPQDIQDFGQSQYLQKFSFAIVPQTKVGVQATRNIDVYYSLKQQIEADQGEFTKPLAIYALPNGETATLYQLIYKDSNDNLFPLTQ